MGITKDIADNCGRDDCDILASEATQIPYGRTWFSSIYCESCRKQWECRELGGEQTFSEIVPSWKPIPVSQIGPLDENCAISRLSEASQTGLTLTSAPVLREKPSSDANTTLPEIPTCFFIGFHSH